MTKRDLRVEDMEQNGNVDICVVEEFVQAYKAAEMILVGVGSELHPKAFDDRQRMAEMLAFFSAMLEKKNYFIITSLQENIFEESNFNQRKIVNPLMMESAQESEEKQWDLYRKWISATLNHPLMLVELGESFQAPGLFRWPFERIVSVHEKSVMYRINKTFYQLPENIGKRAKGICCNSLVFLETVMQCAGGIKETDKC